MFSNMFSIRPNPNYIPGGTENFWVSGSSESCRPPTNDQLENTNKSADVKAGGGKEKAKDGVAKKMSQQHFQPMEKLPLMNGFFQKF